MSDFIIDLVSTSFHKPSQEVSQTALSMSVQVRPVTHAKQVLLSCLTKQLNPSAKVRLAP